MKKRFTYVHGASGTGKTLYVKHMVRARTSAPGGRAVVVDPNGVFDGFGDVVSVKAAAERLSRTPPSAPLALVVRPGWGEKMTILWPRIFQAGRLLLVVDEVQKWARAGRLDPAFLDLNEVARNNWIDMATTSQGPKTIHPILRGNWDTLVTFRQGIGEWAEDLAATYFQRKDLAGAITNLPTFHYLRVTQEGGRRIERGVVELIR